MLLHLDGKGKGFGKDIEGKSMREMEGAFVIFVGGRKKREPASANSCSSEMFAWQGENDK